MTLNEFKAKLLDVVREAYAAGIPALDISLACDAVAAAAGAPIPPNSEMVVPTPPDPPEVPAYLPGGPPEAA